MKAKRITNNRILTTIGLLIFTISLGYGQGFLAEGAIKLLKVNKSTVEAEAPQFIFVDYTNEDHDRFSLKNFVKDAFTSEVEYEEISEVNIARTIHVSAIEVSYEAEIEAEEWMTTPLENNLESRITVESWMTESFNETVESNLEVENWMTKSFSGSVEADLNTEDWMTQPLSASLESELEVEDWMTQPLSASLESEVEVEDWMTQSLITE